MNKKGSAATVVGWVIAGILFIIVIGLVILLLTKAEKSASDLAIIKADPDFHLGDFYEQNLPVYMGQKEIECEEAGGEWVSEETRAGCYDIPLLDRSLCNTAPVLAIRATCMNIKGIFTCTSHEISCEI
jgi:hypothetical protein